MQQEQRVIFVCGLQTPSWAAKKWKKYLEKKFKNHTIHVIGDCKYQFKDIKTMKKLILEIENLIQNSTSSILIGHSMGGILISSLNKELYKLDKIKKIITINSPHTMNVVRPNTFTINNVRYELGYNTNFDIINKNIKILTIGGNFDLTVPRKYSKTPNSRHINLNFEHYILFYVSNYFKRKIIYLIKEL
ncbi:MAG: GPI inositol-deacylase [Nanoarchaeota archaeon]|nr:GPI inositol-deacylase [Nanoarchaeota archaeon]